MENMQEGQDEFNSQPDLTGSEDDSSQEGYSESLISLGWLLFLVGVTLLILNCLESVAPLKFMPSFWWVNRYMWWILAVGAIAVGGFFIKTTIGKDEQAL